MRRPLIYGSVVFAAVWFVGWSTGMGGSPLPNILFSIFVGLLAAGLYALVQWTSNKNRD